MAMMSGGAEMDEVTLDRHAGWCPQVKLVTGMAEVQFGQWVQCE